MDVTTTQQQDWLLYYYNECGMRDCDRIQRSIDSDPERVSEYAELVQRLDGLRLPLLEPSDAVVDRILSFA
ncbi:MAG: hypothetical protein RL021_2095 [Bacteroidota bacterium]|jgi:hypothetical protein